MISRYLLLLVTASFAAAGCGEDGDGSGNGTGGSATGGSAGSTADASAGKGGTSGSAGTGAVAGDGGGGSSGAGTGGSAGSSGASGASGSDAGTCTPPNDGLWATFDVVGEVYRANITNPTGITQAIDLWTGKSTTAIPNGTLICSPAPYNCGWDFHQDPATIQFADFTIEVCDGTPSYVDANCSSFGNQYCPWSAKLTELRDCRTDKSCPLVAKN